MRIKTDIMLSDHLLKEVDELVDNTSDRSALIEEALREYLLKHRKHARVLNDLELINNIADDLNQEALDVLSYQVDH